MNSVLCRMLQIFSKYYGIQMFTLICVAYRRLIVATISSSHSHKTGKHFIFSFLSSSFIVVVYLWMEFSYTCLPFTAGISWYYWLSRMQWLLLLSVQYWTLSYTIIHVSTQVLYSTLYEEIQSCICTILISNKYTVSLNPTWGRQYSIRNYIHRIYIYESSNMRYMEIWYSKLRAETWANKKNIYMKTLWEKE